MGNSTISGDNAANAATVTNATDGSGTPSQNPADVTVVTSNATRSGSGAFFDVSFLGAADLLLADNVPWVNPSAGDSVAFDTIDMGAGNDTVDLTRSGFVTLITGTGDDQVTLTNSGGRTANLGAGNDFARLDLNDALAASDEELAQKDGQPLLALDAAGDTDTVSLVGAWTVSLSSGNVTIDPGNDGIDTTVTNVYTSADYPNITGMPTLLNGTVQWSDPVTLPGGEEVHPAIQFSNFESMDAVCYTAGTLIDTPKGPRDIARLREGDLVSTRVGPMPIRWIGKRRLDLVDLMANPKLLPVRIARDSFGPGRPYKDLLVSPQHRIAVNASVVARMFDTEEILVAAKHLIGIDGIDIEGEAQSVTYIHFMLDAHGLVTANGLTSESLLPGPQALEMLSPQARAELQAIFPDMFAKEQQRPAKPALPILTGREGRAMTARLCTEAAKG